MFLVCGIVLSVILSMVAFSDHIWGFIRFIAKALMTLSVLGEFFMLSFGLAQYFEGQDLAKMTPEEFEEARSEVEFQLEDHLVSVIVISLLVLLAGLYTLAPSAAVKPLWLGPLLLVHGCWVVFTGGLALLFFGGGTLLATVAFLFDKYFDQQPGDSAAGTLRALAAIASASGPPS